MTRTGKQTSPRPLKTAPRRKRAQGDSDEVAVDTRTNQELAERILEVVGTGEVPLWDIRVALKASAGRLLPIVSSLIKAKRLKALGPGWRRRYARAGYQERPRERRDLALPKVQAPPEGGSWWATGNLSREEFAARARQAQPSMRTRLILARKSSHDGIGVWPQS